MKKTSRTPRPRRRATRPGYPKRDEVDLSRRRFLRQTGCAAGGVGLLSSLGLPQLAHGQTIEVDFSLLEAHPSVQALRPAQAAPPEPPARPGPPSAAPSAPPPPPAEDVEVAQIEEVLENRALFLDPGYVAMIKWRRPADNDAVIASLEGSAEAAAAFLAERVTSFDMMHEYEQLHLVEGELAELLQGLVSPAVIEVIHLDHDCTTVCSAFGAFGHDLLLPPGLPPSPGYP